jgi:hypothetical protein
MVVDTPAATDTEAYRHPTLCEPHRADHIAYAWFRIAYGTILAGGIYPMFLGAIVGVFGFWSVVSALVGGNPIGPTCVSAILGLVTLASASVGSSLIGMAFSALTTAVILPVMYLVALTLNAAAGPPIWIGAFTGGLIGFVAVLPLTVIAAAEGPWGSFVVLALGPGLTTVFGQIGGAWGGSLSRESLPTWYKTLAQTGGSTATTDSASVRRDLVRGQQPRIQFGTRHLLWSAVWLSLLLSLIRLADLPYDLALLTLFGWIVFQAITLGAGYIIVRNLGPWWTARCARAE